MSELSILMRVWVTEAPAQGLELVRIGELSIPDSPIRLSLDELFAELDRV